MEIVLIAVVAKNGAIDFPWRISEDMARFKELTMNGPIVMGRRTYEAIGRPLNGRLNIVLSRSDFQAEGVCVCDSLDKVLQFCEEHYKTVFIVGGGSLYEQTIGRANRLEITHVCSDYDGEVFFPEIDSSWKKDKVVSRGGYSFATYVR